MLRTGFSIGISYLQHFAQMEVYIKTNQNSQDQVVARLQCLIQLAPTRKIKETNKELQLLAALDKRMDASLKAALLGIGDEVICHYVSRS